jgi:hypothetical protein
MVMLLTADGVEEVDYTPSDAEIRASLDDPGLYGMVLFGKRLVVTLAPVGWCWVMDGLGNRGYWSAALSAVVADVCAMYGGAVED